MDTNNNQQTNTQDLVTTPLPVKGLPNNNNSIKISLIILFLIFFMVILSILAFYNKRLLIVKNKLPTSTQAAQSPTPNALNTWLTYKSTDFMGGEVSYKYPSSFSPWKETVGMGGERRQVYILADGKSFFEFDRDFECSFSPSPIQLPINSVSDCVGPGTPQQPHRKILIDGREAVEFSNIEAAQDVGKGYEATDYTILILSRDKKSLYSFFIRINSTIPQTIQSNYALFQQIISTVTFI